MDKLQELEEKKRQLKELRERRQNHGGIVTNLLQRSVQNPLMISASVQTDEIETEPIEQQVFNREIITYDKSIQVDLTQELEVLHDSSTLETPEPVEEPAQKKSEEDEHKRSEPKANIERKLQPLEPLVIEDQSNTIHTKSFSILEMLQESEGSHNVDGGSSATGDRFEHMLEWHSQLPFPENGKLICVSLDYHQGLVVVLFRSEPTSKFNTTTATWSYVNVFKWDTGQHVDSIQFRGQSLLWAKFLRRNISSNVLAILITTYTGKTILYELRCLGTENSKRLERNLNIKNYHGHPIYAFSEYEHVVQGKERFLVASTNGLINELSSWDLSVYKDATSNTQPLWKTVIEPPKASEIYGLNQIHDEESEEEDAEREELHQHCFTDHLLRVSLYDELAITSLAICPSNHELIYVGTEDGGIYKLELSELSTQNSLTIHKSNNGFMPNRIPPAFHSSHVVSLLFNRNELLLSASLDWTCCLWDPKTNRKLGQFDTGTPIISAEWLDDDTSAILTCHALFIVSWHISVSQDHRTKIKIYKCSSPPQLECKLDNTNKNFTSFKKFLSKDKSIMLALGSSDSSSVQFYRFKNPQR